MVGLERGWAGGGSEGDEASHVQGEHPSRQPFGRKILNVIILTEKYINFINVRVSCPMSLFLDCVAIELSCVSL